MAIYHYGYHHWLRKHFSITDSGLCHKFLGLNIYQQSNEIQLSLNDYIRKMISDLELSDSEINPVSTPAEINYDLFKNENESENRENEKLCHQTKYRSIIGKLLFSSNTCCFATILIFVLFYTTNYYL